MLVSAIIFVAFSVGWTLSQQQVEEESASSREKTELSETSRVSAPATEMPAEDVLGKDIPGMPRYPGSVRIAYASDDFGKLIVTEVEYLTPARLDAVREFYRDVFRAEGWSIADVGFTRGVWTFFVTQGEREVFVELLPTGNLVEVDFELSEPDPNEPEETTAEPPAQSPGAARPDSPAPQGPVGTPAPAQAPPSQTPPAQAPPAQAPADDDDLDDYYEDDGEGFDD